MSYEMRMLVQAKRDICGNRPDPERLRAAEEVAYRSEWMKKQGWTERPWRPGPKGPWAKRDGQFGIWEFKSTPRWLDHPYRLVNKKEGREIFVAEPYGISDPKVWEDFAELEATGWTVSVDARFALHFPGSTLAIWIEKKRG